MGGCLEAGSRDKWDKIMRASFDGVANFPGGASTVFDYHLDKDRCV
jgi:hypothetical protein